MNGTPARPRIDAIDFWRGFILLSIFINHIPDNVFENFTHRNIGFSDAAEGFVFLSGVSVALAYGSNFLRGRLAAGWQAITWRVTTLFWVQIVIALMALALFAWAGHYFDEDEFLEEDGRDEVLTRPVTGIAGMVLLLHHIDYFDILPLYIALLIGAPFLFGLARRSLAWMLSMSLGLYVLVQLTGLNVPTWPEPGGWHFNPFAWQFIFAIGIAIGVRIKQGRGLPLSRALFILCAVFLLFALWMRSGLTFGDGDLEETIRAYLDESKRALAPARLLHFLALGYFIYYSGLTDWLRRWLPLYDRLALIGRFSLQVFAVGSLLSAVGRVVVSTQGGSVVRDAAIVVSGVLIQYWLAAYLAQRAKRRREVAAAAEPAEDGRAVASNGRFTPAE